MGFKTEDFNNENAQRLSVIIMFKMGFKPLQSFRELNNGGKTKFNRLMNEYIRALPDNWETVLLEDFNRIVLEEILTDDFDPSKTYIKELGCNKELLLSEEQKQYFVENQTEKDKIKV